NLAQMLISRGDYPAALVELRKAISVREQLMRDDPNEKYRGDLARTWSSYGVTLQATGDVVGAEEATGKGLEMRQKLAEDEPGGVEYQSDSARTLMNLAMIRGQLGWKPQVEAPLARATVALERVVNAAPDEPAARLTLGFAHALLCDHLTQVGETSLALG